jgi:hypothetical protein
LVIYGKAPFGESAHIDQQASFAGDAPQVAKSFSGMAAVS